ncbi:MAG TPA: phosphoglycerate kinase [Alphaproteobacteria bacterium]|jgi:phosphoglycerate kinase|nr:phosphoglycerate kinase [Alphaproteobacteria bacterium]
MAADFKTLDDVDVAGKRVLVRVDFNVPVKNGLVTDTSRIERAVPTIKELKEKGARVIILSHFGRPRGKIVREMSLRPVVRPLQTLLGGEPVAFSDDCIGPPANHAAMRLKDGEVALFENLRYHGGEERNDPVFARALATNGQIYVNDAFAAAHRAHASVAAITKFLPSVAGRLMETELTTLERVMTSPERPLAAIIGGAKISTKLDLLGNIVDKINVLIIGGAMANTFLYANGIEVAKSTCEFRMADDARRIMAVAERSDCDIVLPVDVVVAGEMRANTRTITIPVNKVPQNGMILDIGPDSVRAIETRLATCRSLVWNGPLGAFETPPFDAGTIAVAKAVAKLTRAKKLLSVAGGGDTVAALVKAGVVKDFSYVSTAGGAFLEWLEGKELPGLAALKART